MVEADQVSDPVGSTVVLTASFGFFLAGCALLVVKGASLATIHAFAAFIVLAIVAASHQLIPVLTRAPTSRPQAVIAISVPLIAGFGLLITGFLSSSAFLAPGGLTLLGGIVAWVLWTLSRLVLGRLESETRALVALCALAFLVAGSIGAAMAFSLEGILSRDAIRLAPIHALCAIVLFASVLIATVSRRLVPMFALAHSRETLWGRSVPWLVVVGGTAAALGVFYASAPALRAGFVLLIGAALFGTRSLGDTLRQRLRRRLDISLQYAVAAWAFAVLSATLAVAGMWWNPLTTAATACAILGWVSLSIVGYAYKISGFLAWQWAKSRSGDGPLPALASAIPIGPARTALALLSIGTLGIGASLAGEASFSQIAFATYAAGGYTAAGVVVSVALKYVKGAVWRSNPRAPKCSASTRGGCGRPSRWSEY